MGDFSYSNNNGFDASFYGQMNRFLKQLSTEAKLDCYDLRDEKDDHASSRICLRDVLLVRDGKPLLSVFIAVQPTDGSVSWPTVEAKAPEGFGARLAETINASTPVVEAPLRRRLQRLRWWIIFRGADSVETDFEGDQFDLAKINEAFNAIETRLIAELTKP